MQRLPTLPVNILREIYGKADPGVQARMRVSTRDVLNLPAPQMPAKQRRKLVSTVLARARVLVEALPRETRLPASFWDAKKRVEYMGDPQHIRNFDAEMKRVKMQFSLTNADMSRAAAREKEWQKSRSNKMNMLGERLPGSRFTASKKRRYKGPAAKRRRAERTGSRGALANAAAAALVLTPGKGAPFEVLRGGRPRALANAVAASALHPSVAGSRYRPGTSAGFRV